MAAPVAASAIRRVVLLTGANGYLGRYCHEALARAGYEVHAVSRSAHVDQTPWMSSRWHVVDLLDARAQDALFVAVRPTHVLHLAWCVEHGTFWSSPKNHLWVEATGQMFRTCAVLGARVVAAGTCAESGVKRAWRIPSSIYADCKARARDELLAEVRLAGLHGLWARMFYLFGGLKEDPRRLVPSLFRQLLTGETLTIPEPESVRDFSHVREVAQRLVSLLGSARVGIADLRGDEVSLGSLAWKMGVVAGRSQRVQAYAGTTERHSPTLVAGLREAFVDAKARQLANDASP